jgi:hypothetical protein
VLCQEDRGRRPHPDRKRSHMAPKGQEYRNRGTLATGSVRRGPGAWSGVKGYASVGRRLPVDQGLAAIDLWMRGRTRGRGRDAGRGQVAGRWEVSRFGRAELGGRAVLPFGG